MKKLDEKVLKISFSFITIEYSKKYNKNNKKYKDNKLN